MPPSPPFPPAPRIRPYEPRDRKALRALCCDTADAGNPVDSFFPDREIFADLVTRYYTDIEPASSWVAECDGHFAGYLNGCLDTRAFEHSMAFRLLPQLAAKALFRRTTWQAPARAFLALNLPLWLRSAKPDPAETAHVPAHFHINLAPSFRARHVGSALVQTFLAHLQQLRIPGVHANIREDNTHARSFFEHLGFTPLSRHPFLRLPAHPNTLLHSIRYGKTL